jgi:hypothetical protein
LQMINSCILSQVGQQHNTKNLMVFCN